MYVHLLLLVVKTNKLAGPQVFLGVCHAIKNSFTFLTCLRILYDIC